MASVDPDAPIGVFDSGLGGLTVVREVLLGLPSERIIYLGDTARVPYGTRSAETVVRYARGCAGVLAHRGVKMLVVACNTVSAVALDLLRAELDLPVLGVVEPGARAAIRVAENGVGTGRIGVLGTAGTIASGAYPRAVGQLSTRFEVVGQAAPLLVPLVEEGWLEGDVPRLAVERYVAPLIEAEVDVLVLGCTHYPLLQDLVESVAWRLADHPIPVVDSARATASSVAALVHDRQLGARAGGRRGGDAVELLVTDRPASFAAMARRFLGRDVARVTQVDVRPAG